MPVCVSSMDREQRLLRRPDHAAAGGKAIVGIPQHDQAERLPRRSHADAHRALIPRRADQRCCLPQIYGPTPLSYTNDDSHFGGGQLLLIRAAILAAVGSGWWRQRLPLLPCYSFVGHIICSKWPKMCLFFQSLSFQSVFLSNHQLAVCCAVFCII